MRGNATLRLVGAPSTSSDDARALRLGRLVVALLDELAPRAPSAEDLLPLAQAARIAATSPRVLREAIRRGELDAYGRERDRSVRRAALRVWVESRRAVPIVVADADEDIERRMARLARPKR